MCFRSCLPTDKEINLMFRLGSCLYTVSMDLVGCLFGGVFFFLAEKRQNLLKLQAFPGLISQVASC